MTALTIDLDRVLHRLKVLFDDAASPDGGVSRLALTDADHRGRDQLVKWMTDAGLAVSVDAIGNIFGVRAGAEEGPVVMTGSHLDAVRNGGRYDGSYGVIAGLEVIEALNAAGVSTRRPLGVVSFTNEEGVRFAPDMMGSLVHSGGLTLADALESRCAEGASVGDELQRIGYAGPLAPGSIKAHSFVELHIEQGPVLESESVTIGAVENLQGISWTEFHLEGQANHAGTTPLRGRRDAGYVAAQIITFVRRLSDASAGRQLATCGQLELHPGQINVIPGQAQLTVDLRNADHDALTQAEHELDEFVAITAQHEGISVESKRLVRTNPVVFAPRIVETIEAAADRCGYSVRRMTSGAGHDAQMMATVCPSAMIFIPSIGGVSHNPQESSHSEDLGAGVDVLGHCLVDIAQR